MSDNAGHVPYTGSGPYCYANSLAMMLGKCPPSTAVIEFATCSPFGMECIGKNIAFFDPYGWDPAAAFDVALQVMGWESMAITARNSGDALAQLEKELGKGPVFVGPLEMGHFQHQPEMNGPIGADHYVVVLAIDRSDGEVSFHDPHGYPYATLPLAKFMQAWKADKISYGRPYTMRSEFHQVESLSEEDIIRRSLVHARKWLSMEGDHDMPPGSVGNEAAALRLAELVGAGLTPAMRAHFVYFAIRLGARRLIDAATCLSRIGRSEAAEIMNRQARLVGALQYPMVVGDNSKAVVLLQQLAPTYRELGVALQDEG